MRLPNQQQRAIPTASQIGRLAICVVVGLAATLAWSAPVEKDDAVFGFLNYPQFWFAVGSTLLAVSLIVVYAMPGAARRAIGFRLAAVWLGTLVAVGLGEGLAWWLPVRHQMDNPWYFAAGGGTKESDELPFERPPHLRWEGISRGDLAILNGDEDPYARPVVFQTDYQGFRNSGEITNADLVVVGDSFTEAGNVAEEETFTHLIGRKLGLTTRNLGRAGYAPPGELIVLRKYGLACRPKMVVWQVAGSNDLDEALQFRGWVAAGRPRFFDFEQDKHLLRLQGWQRRSPSYQVFEWLRTKRPRAWPYQGVFRDSDGVDHPMRFLRAADLGGSARNHRGWAPLIDAIKSGVELCQSNQIQLLVVFVPTKYRVYGPYTRIPNRPTPSAVSTTNRETFGALLRQVCGELDVEFVDATSALRGKARAGEIVYEPFDTHLSPAGHEVVAIEVASKLQALQTQGIESSTENN